MSREVHTIGYEGHDSETFIWLLQKAGTRVLVDVRRSARSRNRGFAKSALEGFLAAAGIEYVHRPELGVDPELRMALKETGDFAAYRRKYLGHLRRQTDSLDRLYRLMVEQRCCLMCVEHDPQRCHRSVLADHLSTMNGESISIRHL